MNRIISLHGVYIVELETVSTIKNKLYAILVMTSKENMKY